MESLWRKQTGEIHPRSDRNQNLDKKSYEDICWDVIVAGAGLTGLLIAYYLKEEGKNVLVLEAKTIGSGQTERTTAKITSQHDLKYSKLIKTVGTEKARMYAQANEAAIREYERFIQVHGIECQFKKVPAYLYSMQDALALKEEAKVAASFGINAFFTTETELPFTVKGAVCFRNQAQFSPLEFVKHISAELNILEHTRVIAVRGNQVITESMTLAADKIVIATHYPVINVPGFYFIRQHQERSYVLALSECDNLKNEKLEGMYLGIDENALSFRQAGDVLLLGGSSHRTGECKKAGAYHLLEQAAEKYFPAGKEVTRWSAQDCMPHDGIPFIGKYSMLTPDLYVATGFQKWGMTSAMVAAMILRDELCGIENPYAKLFSPQRLNLKASIGNLMIDAGMSVKGLTKGLLCKKAPRCPHLGCELVWNPDEKSWDCPCHGSRFDGDGKLLDNPAKKGIERKE